MSNFLHRHRHRIPLDKEPEFFTAILPSRHLVEELYRREAVRDLEPVFNNVFKVRTREYERDDLMDALRSSSRLPIVCHHAYNPVGDPGTRYYLTDRIQLRFKEGVSIPRKEELLQAYGLKLLRPYPGVKDAYLLQITNSTGMNPVKACSQLHELEEIQYAEPNLINRFQPDQRPADTLFRYQWHLESRDDIELVAGAGVGALKAWETTRGERRVVVAVLDDGFDLTHPDFNAPGKLVGPRDFVDGDAVPLPERARRDFHGTPCAGVAIGEENGIGTVGMAPGCSFMPIRFDLAADDNLLFEIFDYAGSRAHVLSNSWSPPPVFAPLSSLIFDKIEDLTRNGGPDGNGCVILFSAGNFNAPIVDMENAGGFVWRHPALGLRETRGAMFNGFGAHPDVMTISASTSQNRKSAYSNWGAEISVCAPSDNWNPLDPQARLPGLGIWTTDNETHGLGFTTGSRFTGSFGGTSSACPLVAGVAALMRSVNPQLTAAEVREIIEATADKIVDENPDPVLNQVKGVYDESGHSPWFGFGKVNAAAAVMEAKARLPEEEPEEEEEQPEEPQPEPAAELHIAAALPNPSGREIGNERILLLNTGNRTTSLRGWTIVDRVDRREELPPFEVEPGTAVTVTLRQARLPNSGGVIKLYNPEGILMDKVTYSGAEARRENWWIRF